jgi:large-conductance mechanosensitive channel
MNNQINKARISESAKGWIVPLARFGYAAKGAVYIIIGIISAWGALQSGGQTTGSRGALETILQQPFGQILLGITAVGLFGYAVWRFVQAVKDTENRGSDAKGIIMRILSAIVGVAYLGLTYSAVRLILGSGGGSGGNSKDEWTATLLAQPFGQFLVAAVGLGFIAYAVYQFYKAYTAKFREKLKTNEMSRKMEEYAVMTGRIGLTARGIVFGIIGVFLMQAAINYNPSQTTGLSGALQSLEQQPFGPFILGFVALGLIAYGVFMIVMAIYRRIIID